MSQGRSRTSIRLVRKLQPLTLLLRPIDGLAIPFLKRESERSHGPIVILAPPRSGSTLLYQVLRSGLKSVYLSNFQNFFFSSPQLAYLLTRGNCQRTYSSFHSHHGFVQGLCGESEGYRFWKYWMRQGLEKTEGKTPEKRIRKLSRKIERMEMDRDGPLIAGYLGHVLSVPTLLQAFPNALFLHLKRDLLSNANSLLSFSPDQWRSTRPPGHQQWLSEPREEQVLEQIFQIHRMVNEKKHEAPERFLELRYQELCHDPRGLLERVRLSKGEIGPVPELRDEEHLPGAFPEKISDPDHPDNAELQKRLEKRLASLPPEEKAFYTDIFRPSSDTLPKE